MNSARSDARGSGTQTAIYLAGGSPNGTTNVTTMEEYDGSSWTAGPDLNATHPNANMFGTSTAAILGGNPSNTATEEWNGTNWSVTGVTMGTPRNAYGMGGTTTAGLAFGGSPYTTATEEYSPAAATKTFTTS